ncbi:thioredoxin-like domain-containing protein, partial [Phaeosphaeriaceae sp. PMI808]
IDCDDNLELCHDHDINTYPAIRLYERDKEDELREVRYRGPRTINAIRSFVRKRELPILTKLSSSDMEDFKMMDDLVVIAYLDPNDQASLDTIKYAAERHHLDFVFGYTTSTSQGVSTPSLICYRNTDADHRTLTDLLSLSTIESFLVTSLQPAITSFSEKNIATYMQRDKLTLYIFIPHSYPTSILLRTLTPLAKQFVKFVAFTLVDVQRYTDMAGNFGVGVGSAGPVIVVHAPGNDNVFLYEEGRRIERGVVEGMLMGILKGEARSGQVFGGEARWE